MLWSRLSHKLLSQQTHATPQQKHRIRLLIDMRSLQLYSPPTVEKNQRKRPLLQENQLFHPTKRSRYHTHNPTPQLPRTDAAVPDPANLSYLENDEEDQKLPTPPNQLKVTNQL